jgi:hypothetical protein
MAHLSSSGVNDYSQDGCHSLSKSIISSLLPEVEFSRSDKRSKQRMLETVHTLPAVLHQRLKDEVERKKWRKLCDVEEETECDVETDDEEHFLEAADPTTIEKCIADFIDATGNNGVRQMVCAVCAREMWAAETTPIRVQDLPNKHLLVPVELHSAYKLTFGMLLESNAIKEQEGILQAHICKDCLRSMTANELPPLSLANDMWVGEVPEELSRLNLVERILVARYFPAAYIVKLFPKQRGATKWPASGVNSGLKGNVSTYRLNTEDIKNMVDSDIMPPPARILASTIGVTIVGPKNIPDRTMPGFLKVRRDYIRDALIWLHTYNPLYANIIVSEPRLGELPEEGIPNEILCGIRHLEDTREFDAQRSGYVEDDDNIRYEEGPDVVAAGGSIRNSYRILN